MTMRPFVKICGLRTPDDVATAVDAGADAVGFVFAPGSPRTIEQAAARDLAAEVPAGVWRVGVFRAQPIAEVLAIAEAVGLDTVQLHGDERPEDAEAARARGHRVIRAVSAETWLAETEAQRSAYGEVTLLLDAPEPGSGVPSEADLTRDAAPRAPWLLAGGLTPDNVAAFIERLAPAGVDVSSGVESSRGVKDHARIRAFVRAARQA